jgi:hypothetical protein
VGKLTCSGIREVLEIFASSFQMFIDLRIMTSYSHVSTFLISHCKQIWGQKFKSMKNNLLNRIMCTLKAARLNGLTVPYHNKVKVITN